jgi:hypothetical protein
MFKKGSKNHLVGVKKTRNQEKEKKCISTVDVKT